MFLHVAVNATCARLFQPIKHVPFQKDIPRYTALETTDLLEHRALSKDTTTTTISMGDTYGFGYWMAPSVYHTIKWKDGLVQLPGIKRHWPHYRYYLASVLETLRKTTKLSSQNKCPSHAPPSTSQKGSRLYQIAQWHKAQSDANVACLTNTLHWCTRNKNSISRP